VIKIKISKIIFQSILRVSLLGVFIVLGLFFYISLIWLIKISAIITGLNDLSGNFIILTAGLITAATIISTGTSKYSK
jgi:hypothetical protein